MKATQVSALVSDYASTLLASPLFQGFTEENLRNFFSHAELLVKDYKKNDFVALSGTPMEGLGIILEGALLITRENVLGQRVIMTEFYPSQMFGEALIFSHQPLWPATIKTTKASKVLFIPIHAFLEALPKCQVCQTTLLANLLRDLSDKTLILTRKVHYLTLKGMRQRIFAYLSDIYRQQGTTSIKLPHTREQIAEIINVSRTAMSREMSRMEKEGLIEVSGKTIILKDIDAMTDFDFNN